MKLNYRIENLNDIDKPWLVLINGLFASLESWNESIRDFTTSFRVLRYDCRGQGESPKPQGPYLLSEHVLDLKNLLNDLNISSSFLVGISNGGRIALSFSQIYPKNIKAIVVADSYDNITPLLERKLISWKEANRIGGALHRFDIATPWVWGESIVKDKPELLAFYRNRADIEKSEVIEGLIDGALKEEIDVSQITAPTLLLAGEEDLLTPPFMQTKLLRKIKNSKMLLVKGGHASLLEYPENVKISVLPFLKEYV